MEPCVGAGLPKDPFMWCGSMPPMPPIGPSEPGPIGNCGEAEDGLEDPGPLLPVPLP